MPPCCCMACGMAGDSRMDTSCSIGPEACRGQQRPRRVLGAMLACREFNNTPRPWQHCVNVGNFSTIGGIHVPRFAWQERFTALSDANDVTGGRNSRAPASTYGGGGGARDIAADRLQQYRLSRLDRRTINRPVFFRRPLHQARV
jgi:hypothetical protein